MLGSIVLAILVAHPLSGPLSGEASTTLQPPASGAQATAEKPWPPVGVARSGAGVKAPRLIRGKEPKPSYTAEAIHAKIEGIVVMEAVVEADGTVGDVRVTRSLDREFGLDEEAVRTVKKWRFEPGTKDEVAVPVLVVVEMSFTLKK